MRFAHSKPNDALGRFVEKNRDALSFSGDGTDQGQER
jgi:hypothetical protein